MADHNINNQIRYAKSYYSPSRDSYNVRIPLTFNRSAESKFNPRVAVFSTIISVLAFIIITILIFRSYMVFPMKLLVFLGLIFLMVLFINFFVMKGSEKRNALLELMDRDYQLSPADIWGILDTEREYPYINHFASGYRGVFVKFNKDVKEGRGTHGDYDHYNGIANMYNLAHKENLEIVHCDYMENIGNDPRVEDVLDRIDMVTNVDYQNMLASMYRHLERITSTRFSTFDVYLFLTRDVAVDIGYKVRKVAQRGTSANYKGFIILNREGIRELTNTVFNLDSFSANLAQKELVKESESTKLKLIKIINPDGTEEIYNKTRQQLSREREHFAEERAKAKKERKTNKNTTKSNVSQNKASVSNVEVFDIDNRESVVSEKDIKVKKSKKKGVLNKAPVDVAPKEPVLSKNPLMGSGKEAVKPIDISSKKSSYKPQFKEGNRDERLAKLGITKKKRDLNPTDLEIDMPIDEDEMERRVNKERENGRAELDRLSAERDRSMRQDRLLEEEVKRTQLMERQIQEQSRRNDMLENRMRQDQYDRQYGEGRYRDNHNHHYHDNRDNYNDRDRYDDYDRYNNNNDRYDNDYDRYDNYDNDSYRNDREDFDI